MAIDVKSITQLITEFRALQAKDAITPESLGYILQRLADLIATAGTSETVTEIKKLLDGFKLAGSAVVSISQSTPDRNHIYVHQEKLNLQNGVKYDSNGIFIQQATTERAGAMRAQQVIDLNNTRRAVADIEKILQQVQIKLGMTEGTRGLYNNAQITVQVSDDSLLLFGGSQLVADGYVPYLFRQTRKRNRWYDRVAIGAGAPMKKYCDKRKGWNLFGSVHTVKLNGTVLTFTTSIHSFMSKEASGYTSSPTALVRCFTNSRGEPCFAWGRSVVSLLDPKNPQKHRMIRLRFAVGFAKKIYPGRTRITPANLVSSLAEFSVIYNPTDKSWHFGR